MTTLITDPTPAPVRDAIVRASQDMPDLIARAKQVDPDLYKSLAGSALLASRGVWGPPIAFALSWLVAHYGLTLDADTQALLAGLVSLGVGALIRIVWTRGPITSVLPPPPADGVPHA